MITIPRSKRKRGPKTKRRRRGNARGGSLQPRENIGGNLVMRINPRFPNDIKMMPIHNRVFRFNCGSQTGTTLSPSVLLSLLVSGVAGSATVNQLMQSFKLRRISLYSVPSTNDFGSATAEIVFTWLSILNAPGNLVVDRGTSTVPACIKVIPPPETLAGFWYASTSTNVTSNLFQFSCPANSVLDIDIDFVLQWGTPNTHVMSSGALVGAEVFIPSLSASIIPDGGNFTAVL